MSATLLEQARSAHEEIERLERLIVKDLQQEAKGHKEKLHQSHRVKNFLDTIVGDSARLVSPALSECDNKCYYVDLYNSSITGPRGS